MIAWKVICKNHEGSEIWECGHVRSLTVRTKNSATTLGEKICTDKGLFFKELEYDEQMSNMPKDS